jgi:selenocysteine lyase/cysteine desulfurase
VKGLSAYLRSRLTEINKVRVLDKGPEVCGLITFTVQGGDPVYLTQELLNRKITVVPSYRNFAVIDFDEKNVSWALRASPHYFNTTDEIDQFIDGVKEII